MRMTGYCRGCDAVLIDGLEFFPDFHWRGCEMVPGGMVDAP